MTNNKKDIKEKIAKVNKKDKEGMVKKVKKENEDITNLSEKKQYSIAKRTGKKIMKKKEKGRGLKTNILTLLQTISSLKFDNETLKKKKKDKSEDKTMKEYYSKLLENNKEYKAEFVRPNHIKTSFIYIDEESVSFKKYFVELGVLSGFKTPMNTVFSSKALNELKNETDEKLKKKEIEELLDSFSKEWLGMSFNDAIARAQSKEEKNDINYYILQLIKVKLYLDYYPGYKIPPNKFKEMVDNFENKIGEIINSTVFRTILKNLSPKGKELSKIIREKNTRSIKGEETVYIASFNKIPFSKEELNDFIKENKIEKKEVSDGVFKKIFSKEGKEIKTIQETTKKEFINDFIPTLIKYLLDLYSVINYDDNKAKKEKMFSYEIIKNLLEALQAEVDDETRKKIEAEIKKMLKKEGRVLQKIVEQLKEKLKEKLKDNKDNKNNIKLFYMFNIMKKEVLGNNKKIKEYKKWLEDLFSSKEFLSKIEKENFVENIILKKKPQGECSIDVSNNDRSLKLKFKVKKDDSQNNTNIKNIIYTTEFFYDVKSKGILDYYENNKEKINENIQTYINLLNEKNEPELYQGIITLSNTLPEDFREKVEKRIKEILSANKTESKKEIFKKILKMLDKEITEIEDGSNSDNINNINDNFKNRIKNLIVVKITNTDIDEENGIIELIGLSSDIKQDTYIEEYSTISENIRSIYYKMQEEEKNITIQELKEKFRYKEDDIKKIIDAYGTMTIKELKKTFSKEKVDDFLSVYTKVQENNIITIQDFKKEVGYNEKEKDDIKNFIDVYMELFLKGKTDNDTINKTDIVLMGIVAFFLTMLNVLLDDLKVLGRNTKAKALKSSKKTKVNNSSKKQAVVKKQEKINNANKKAKEIFNKKK